MIRYKTSDDNKEYIVMEDPGVLITFLKNNYYSGNQVLSKACDSYNDLINNRYLARHEFKDLAIKKDSDLGKYICDERTNYLFENMDNIISFEDVVNAFNTSIIDENPVARVLREMMVSQVQGETCKLGKKYGDIVIDYIKENHDFYRYVKIANNEYETLDSIVYDDGGFHISNLYEMQKHGKKLVKSRDDNEESNI